MINYDNFVHTTRVLSGFDRLWFSSNSQVHRMLAAVALLDHWKTMLTRGTKLDYTPLPLKVGMPT